MRRARTLLWAMVGALALIAFMSDSQEPAPKLSEAKASASGALKTLTEIQKAAEALDAEAVFSHVLENDAGAMVQDGRLFLTRAEALENTKQGFQALSKVSYRLESQQATMLSPTIALVVGTGASTATLHDGRTFTTAFTQSVLLISTNGEWKVFHAHRSFPKSR